MSNINWIVLYGLALLLIFSDYIGDFLVRMFRKPTNNIFIDSITPESQKFVSSWSHLDILHNKPIKPFIPEQSKQLEFNFYDTKDTKSNT